MERGEYVVIYREEDIYRMTEAMNEEDILRAGGGRSLLDDDFLRDLKRQLRDYGNVVLLMQSKSIAYGNLLSLNSAYHTVDVTHKYNQLCGI